MSKYPSGYGICAASASCSVASRPFLSYAGPYDAGDLADLYSGVHLAWAIDYFEAGQNSAWLLPNRIYEGCLHGAIPIALAGTETASFIENLGIGIVLPDTEPHTLVETIGALDAAPAGVVASIDGLLPTELAAVASEFRDECGLSLELRGQMSLF